MPVFLEKTKIYRRSGKYVDARVDTGLEDVCDKVLQYTTRNIWQKQPLAEFNMYSVYL